MAPAVSPTPCSPLLQPRRQIHPSARRDHKHPPFLAKSPKTTNRPTGPPSIRNGHDRRGTPVVPLAFPTNTRGRPDLVTAPVQPVLRGRSVTISRGFPMLSEWSSGSLSIVSATTTKSCLEVERPPPLLTDLGNCLSTVPKGGVSSTGQLRVVQGRKKAVREGKSVVLSLMPTTARISCCFRREL